MKSGCPYSTGWPFSHKHRFTTPEASASNLIHQLHRPMMQIVWPSLMVWPTSTKGLASGDAER